MKPDQTVKAEAPSSPKVVDNRIDLSNSAERPSTLIRTYSSNNTSNGPSEPKVFFDWRVPDNIQNALKQILSELENYNSSVEILFLAQLARNLKTMLSRCETKTSIIASEFVVKPSRPLNCPETKLIALKSTAKSALEDSIKRVDTLIKDYVSDTMSTETKTFTEHFLLIVEEV